MLPIRPVSARAALLLCAIPLAACQHGQQAPSSRAEPPTDGRESVFDMVNGTWDWARGDSTCQGNRHVISFSGDRREMVLTFRSPIDTVTRQRIVRYRVVQSGGTVLPNIPWVIRAAMEGEQRRAPQGDLVVWDLILATPNRYHWRRTDWGPGGITNAIIRCDGTRPLERWGVPAPPSSGWGVTGN